jgi:phosphoribosylformimino-5-aminoimidazole carboxamide ribonucleotide (ProFAR) isomerase
MMQDPFKKFVKDTLAKGLASGGVTTIEEIANTLTVEQLEGLIVILKRIHDKKKNVVDSK